MLQELKTQHREIARLRFEGVTPQDIAKRLNMSYQSVSAILRDPLCKSYLEGLHDKADTKVIDVRKRLAEMNVDALKVFQYILTSKKVTDPVKLSAAKDVLDRTGHKVPEKHEHLVGVFTAKDIQELRQRAESVNTKYMEN